MLKKALTTIGLATVLLTSSISANELATKDMSITNTKVETIGVFENIPSESLNATELETAGEWYVSLFWGAVRFGSANK